MCFWSICQRWLESSMSQWYGISLENDIKGKISFLLNYGNPGGCGEIKGGHLILFLSIKTGGKMACQ